MHRFRANYKITIWRELSEKISFAIDRFLFSFRFSIRAGDNLVPLCVYFGLSARPNINPVRAPSEITSPLLEEKIYFAET
jgi:hypothetical protein